MPYTRSMNRGGARISGLALLCLLAGCTITQEAEPVALRPTDPAEMCVIEDPAVDETFLPAYRAALERNGFTVRMLPAGAAVSACPLTSTYYGRWSWDFVPYMSIGKIVVYRDGQYAGRALYDAPKAGFSMTTRIYESTQSKIDTMVDQLFPSGAPRA